MPKLVNFASIFLRRGSPACRQAGQWQTPQCGAEEQYMKYFVYIIKSEKDFKNYIGFTTNLKVRLELHNAGKNKSTKYRMPFVLIYFREFDDKYSAMKFKRWLKNQKGGFKVKELIKNFKLPAWVAQW